MARCFMLAITLVGCVAVTRSPPLSSKGVTSTTTFGNVLLTSGTLARPARPIGVIQMRQQGYKWFHEVELVDDANPASILYRIGEYAREMGADGVQHLELRDLDPKSPAEVGAKQVDTFLNLGHQIQNRQTPTALGDGTRTYYLVKGELVKLEESTR
jgi:hypothetical protein